MNKYDLSVVIPARNEQFLSLTVEDIVKNKRGNTEVIVVLDGEWANPPVKDHKDVTILYFPESIGQRAATNQGVRLSQAKYIMKIDGHCRVDEGFDVKMMNEMKDNYTMIPTLYNLHAFDFVCPKCGNRTYQGPTLTKCLRVECDGVPNREMVWKPRMSRKSEFYRFDTTLHFQYHGARKKDVSPSDILVETQSAQGSCFMLTRDKYWELNISDEKYGSWGQQGTEVACKTWLSGGRLVTNRKTWYSHLFRTQGGDFSFPYPQSGNQVENARKYSREQFINNQFDKQIYPLSWLLEKFKPLPDWHEPSGKVALEKVMREGELFYKRKNINKPPTKGIIYYTNNKVPLKIGARARKTILESNLPIVSVSMKPMDFGMNIVYKGESGYLAYHKQILLALENSTADIIYFCEHDVFYHPSHFEFTPTKKDIYYYNFNWWRVRATDGHSIHYDTNQVNFIVAYRKLLLQHYREKVRRIEKDGFNMRMGFEPGCNRREERVDDFKSERFDSAFPNLDIRHGENLTKSRWSVDEFRNQSSCKNWKEKKMWQIPGWKVEQPFVVNNCKPII